MEFYNYMQKKRYIGSQRHGVALLFALGVLSLLLILALAFVTNAVVARKVAYNNSSRSQAKMLAQSAISRIATAIMLYQYQAENPGSNPKFWPTEFTGVYSYDKNHGNSFDDQLHYTTPDDGKKFSKLNYPDNTIGYKGYESKAKWAFFYDKPLNDADRKIIGRVAYQVLPPTSNGRLNLSQSMLGVTNRSSSQKRLGKDIDDINVEVAGAFKDRVGTATLKDMLNPLNEPDFKDVPVYYDDLYTALKSNVFLEPSPPNTEDGETEDRKSWIERWFSEGPKSTEYEAFLYQDGNNKNYAFRFNLGEDGRSPKGDDWYNRFYLSDDYLSSFTPGDPDVITRLTRNAIDFKEQAKRTPFNSGLPFLNQIGNDSEAHTFDNITDWRNQIAANLIAYCSKDLIPTSNISAMDWLSTTDDSIKYTGNEKTPYIYEVGFQGTITNSENEAISGIQVDKATRDFKFNLNLLPAVKLINIYDSIPNSLTNFSFFHKVKEIELHGEITKITYNNFEYLKNIGGGKTELQSVTSPIVVDLTSPVKFTKKWEEANIEELANPQSISFTSADFHNGYAFKAANNNFFKVVYQSAADDASSKPKIPAANENDLLKSLLPNFNSFPAGQTPDIEIKEVKLTEFSVKNGRMVLTATYKYQNYDGVEVTKNNMGIDYVRPQVNQILSTKTDATLPPLIFDETNNNYKFLLGGLRGIDPRQNLNERDWSITAPAFKIFDSTLEWQAVMDVTFTSGAPSPYQGKVNRESVANPRNSPEDGAIDTKKDQETTTDPSSGRLSTAYIANKPMESLWELGAIHRGIAWQTLNLKRACSPANPSAPISLEDHRPGATGAGTTYEGGDGGILDQVKINNKARSFGKVDVNMLWNNTTGNPNYTVNDNDIVKALFVGLKYGQHLVDYTENSSANQITKDNITQVIIDAMIENDDASRPFDSRAQLLHWKSNPSNSSDYFGNIFGLISPSTDAGQEEIIGKTMNLLTASNGALPNVIQVLVVAQTIRDIGGKGTTQVIVKQKANNSSIEHPCQLGQFDIEPDPTAPKISPDKHVYFDEITGEVKMLVTIDRNPDPGSGKLMVRKIEYLD